MTESPQSTSQSRIAIAFLMIMLILIGCYFLGYKYAQSAAYRIEVAVVDFMLKMEENRLTVLLQLEVQNPTLLSFSIVDGWFTTHFGVYTIGEGRLSAPVTLPPNEKAYASASFIISYPELGFSIVQAIRQQALSKKDYKVEGSLTVKAFMTFSFYVLFESKGAISYRIS